MFADFGANVGIIRILGSLWVGKMDKYILQLHMERMRDVMHPHASSGSRQWGLHQYGLMARRICRHHSYIGNALKGPSTDFRFWAKDTLQQRLIDYRRTPRLAIQAEFYTIV